MRVGGGYDVGCKVNGRIDFDISMYCTDNTEIIVSSHVSIVSMGHRNPKFDPLIDSFNGIRKWENRLRYIDVLHR